MPDTWRCECGYTNLGSKTCLVCRRPRQAVPPSGPEPVEDPTVDSTPAPAPAAAAAKKARKRPLKAPSAKKATSRRRAK